MTKNIHIARTGRHVSGGEHETFKTGKRIKRKTGQHSNGGEQPDKQAPHKQKARIENKHVAQGDIINEWCRGKRGCYK